MSKVASFIPDNKKWIFDEIVITEEDKMRGSSKFKMNKWKGYNFPPGFEGETARYVYDEMNFEENTVFIITYPKCGTHWIEKITRTILDDDEIYHNESLYQFPVKLLECSKAIKFELLKYVPKRPKVFPSHLPEELFNVNKIKKQGGKIIVFLRNPKDQAVSWFHFTKDDHFNTTRELYSDDWSQFLNDYVEGKHKLFSKDGDWYLDHILGWYKRRNEDHVLFLYYEDMKEDLEREIRKIAKFVGVVISADKMQKILDDSSFQSMKKAWHGINSKIFREGKVGDWKKLFTVAQSENMDKLIKEKLGHTDIKFKYQL